jgi:hypothetical protein
MPPRIDVTQEAGIARLTLCNAARLNILRSAA